MSNNASNNGRLLTPGEVELAQSMFGDGIEYQDVKIFNSKWIGAQPDGRVMAPNGNIYYPPGDSRYTEDMSRGTVEQQATFIHEMTHVWQRDHQSMFEYSGTGLSERNYNYEEIFDGTAFKDLGMEEQAEFLKDCWLKENGHDINPNKGGDMLENPDRPFSDYEAALPDDYLESTFAYPPPTYNSELDVPSPTEGVNYGAVELSVDYIQVAIPLANMQAGLDVDPVETADMMTVLSNPETDPAIIALAEEEFSTELAQIMDDLQADSGGEPAPSAEPEASSSYEVSSSSPTMSV